MARRQDTQKHPALAAKAIENKAGQQLARLEGYEEWYKLSDKERRFLTFYIQCRDGLKAARETDVSPDWLASQQEKNPPFAAFLQEIMDHPRELAKMILEDILPESAQELAGLMYQDENLPVKLNAIKHLHGVTLGPESVTAGAPGPTINVNLFDMGEHEARVIEGEVSNGHHP